MSIKKEIIHGKGFAVVKIPNLKKFEFLRNTFLKKMNIKGKNKVLKLRQMLASMKNHEVNKAMIKLLSFSEASEIMIESFSEVIKDLCGKKLLIQRRANTIFNLPGEEQRRQWPHYELMSGISPFTFVVWAPFHDLDDDGGVYYVPQNVSFETIKLEHSKGLVNGPTILNKINKFKPTKLKFGEAIIFNPFILHGNVSFNSKLARIACSVRFQSSDKPIMQKNTDFFKRYQLI